MSRLLEDLLAAGKRIIELEAERDQLRAERDGWKATVTRMMEDEERLREALAAETEARRHFMRAATEFGHVIEGLTKP
jgi:hypothetical protein